MSEVYYVGIDLGTSRTSVATSTGVRMTVDTVVGYAKDMISKKRLGANYLLGKDAIKNRLALNMIWPMVNGVIQSEDSRNLEATRLIMMDVIHRAIPGIGSEDKVCAAIGLPARASMKNKADLLELTKGFLHKLLIVSEPFSVAYGLDRLDEVLVVDIGAGTSDLCRISGSLPKDEDQITLAIAGNYLDQIISEAILVKYPRVQLTPQIVKRLKEKYGYVISSEPIQVTLTEAGKPGTYDITDILGQCCSRFADPIFEAVRQLVGGFDPEFQHKLRNNIIVAGGGSRLRGIDRAIEHALIEYGGGDVTVVRDTEFAGAEGSLKLSVEMPDEYWEKL